MGRLYCLLGKSCAGKDTVFARLMADGALGLRSVVTYTTRPRRAGEVEGREYHFVRQEEFDRIRASGRMIESRTYHTVQGDWHYFTVDDGQVDLLAGDYLLIGTLESYEALKRYYGADRVVGLYLTIGGRERLMRLIGRESVQSTPDWREVCRRFLADEEDFSEEKLARIELMRYENDCLDACVDKIRAQIASRCEK